MNLNLIRNRKLPIANINRISTCSCLVHRRNFSAFNKRDARTLGTQYDETSTKSNGINIKTTGTHVAGQPNCVEIRLPQVYPVDPRLLQGSNYVFNQRSELTLKCRVSLSLGLGTRLSHCRFYSKESIIACRVRKICLLSCVFGLFSFHCEDFFFRPNRPEGKKIIIIYTERFLNRGLLKISLKGAPRSRGKLILKNN